MTMKARVKIGEMEFEYEGAVDFFKDEFLDIIKGLRGRTPQASQAPTVGSNKMAAGVIQQPSTSSGTTRSVAARLGVKTGPDLLEAGAARLVIVARRESFRRQDLLDEIKTATGYFKANMVKNLSKYLKRLITDGRFIELASEVYTLSADARADLEQRLA